MDASMSSRVFSALEASDDHGKDDGSIFIGVAGNTPGRMSRFAYGGP